MFTILFIFFLFSNILLKIQSNTNYTESLEIVAQFNVIKFEINSQIVECRNCMPAGIKLSKNGDIFCSFPRWYENVTATFAKFNEINNTFEPWPSYEYNTKYEYSNPSGLNSVLGFEIDDENFLYILDQGKINGEEALEGAIKVLKFSIDNNSLIREYIFDEEIADRNRSFLNDIHLIIYFLVNVLQLF